MSGDLLDLRLLIFGDRNHSEQDDLIGMLQRVAEQRLKLILNRTARGYGHDEVTCIPHDLAWIVAEVVARRFNRIGSEGMKSESVEGHAITYDADDFVDYVQLIDDYYKPIEPEPDRRGSVVGYP